MKKRTKTSTVPFSVLKKAIVIDAESKQAFEAGCSKAAAGMWLRSEGAVRPKSQQPKAEK